MKAPLRKEKKSGKRKTAPMGAKKATSKRAKKSVLAKSAIKSKPSKALRKNEAETPATSLFLNPEVSPAHRHGHRRINLKENAIAKPGRTAAR